MLILVSPKLKLYGVAVEKVHNKRKQRTSTWTNRKTPLQTQWYWVFKNLDWKGKWKTGNSPSLAAKTIFKSDLELAISLPECIQLFPFKSRMVFSYSLLKDWSTDQVLKTKTDNQIINLPNQIKHYLGTHFRSSSLQTTPLPMWFPILWDYWRHIYGIFWLRITFPF